MESLPKISVHTYPSGTLEIIRKCWGLDKPGKMKEAVTILDDWARKQPHFLNTDFAPEFLENTIIASKGSIERAKLRLDKYCTLKTLMPKYYEKFDYKIAMMSIRSELDMGVLPKFTSEYDRVAFIRLNGLIQTENHIKFLRHIIVLLEHVKRLDYFNSIVLIIDFRFIDLIAYVKNINIMELREILTILIEGYAVRVSGIHCLTESTMIEVFLAIIKRMIKPSISNRIKVHKNEASLFEYVNKDILPFEYGGKEKTLKDLHDDMLELLYGEEHIEYMEKTRKYGIEETLRPIEKFHENYIGMPGTFRMLSVD